MLDVGDARGETLIEVVIALLLLGIAVMAILGAVTFGSLFSGDHRSLTAAEIAVKTATEQVKDHPYVSGAGHDAYDGAVTAPPAGYAVEVGPVHCAPDVVDAVVDVEEFVVCSTLDRGLQLVTVTVTSDDGRAVETARVMKRSGT